MRRRAKESRHELAAEVLTRSQAREHPSTHVSGDCRRCELLDAMIAQLTPRQHPFKNLGDLTFAELEVLKRLTQGQSNGEIAAALGKSIRTVKTQCTALYRKLGIRGRNGLLGWMGKGSRLPTQVSTHER